MRIRDRVLSYWFWDVSLQMPWENIHFKNTRDYIKFLERIYYDRSFYNAVHNRAN
ncbi:gp063 (endogenous virus) [Lactococcus phage KSY1]|uniref:Gp063 n=1 Tax=Lactococcus phage KSY1 TaxID=2913972 RepID=A6MAC8_9CAUD|nr:gp063 [Lactococcus phage KSY1]ABG21606.1 gp063 [Lactococcus phage KSY1]